MILYEAYNENNGRAYIGLTTKTLDYRKSQHLRSAKAGSMSHFHKAIRKHGKEAFSWDVIMVCNSLTTWYRERKRLDKGVSHEVLRVHGNKRKERHE